MGRRLDADLTAARAGEEKTSYKNSSLSCLWHHTNCVVSFNDISSLYSYYSYYWEHNRHHSSRTLKLLFLSGLVAIDRPHVEQLVVQYCCCEDADLFSFLFLFHDFMSFLYSFFIHFNTSSSWFSVFFLWVCFFWLGYFGLFEGVFFVIYFGFLGCFLIFGWFIFCIIYILCLFFVCESGSGVNMVLYTLITLIPRRTT